MLPNHDAWCLMWCALLPDPAAAQEPPTPWRDDPLFQRLATALDHVAAIDTHTHLLRPGQFDPTLATRPPLMNRSTHPWFSSILKARFGITAQPADSPSSLEAIAAARAAMIKSSASMATG
jgi:hypothetical protein